MLFTVVEGDGVGRKLLVVEGGETIGDGAAELGDAADEIQRGGRNRLLELDGRKVFAEVYGPPPRLLVYGAVDTAEALCRGAKLLGWTAIVGRRAGKFATRERIPSADELIVAWPEEALAQVAPDHQTAIVVLTHDDKFDEPALQGALETDAFYIGALGSRRNQQRRRERLLEPASRRRRWTGSTGPCGLDIGADTRRRRRSRSLPRSSPSAQAGAAARCARRSSASTSKSNSAAWQPGWPGSRSRPSRGWR